MNSAGGEGKKEVLFKGHHCSLSHPGNAPCQNVLRGREKRMRSHRQKTEKANKARYKKTAEMEQEQRR